MLNECLLGKIIQAHIDNSDHDSFVVGRLVYFDSIWFLMQDLSPMGCWNGLALYKQADIVLIETHSEYIYRIEKLIKYRNETMPSVPNFSRDPLLSLLCYAKDYQRVVGIELHESGYRDINGFVTTLNNDAVRLEQLDEFGKRDGSSYVSIDAITRCYLDDDESRCLEVLAH